MKLRRKSPTPTISGTQYSGTRSTLISTMQRPMKATMSPAIISLVPEPSAMPEILETGAVDVKAPSAGSSPPPESGIIGAMSLSSGAPVTAGDLLMLEELGRLRRTSPIRGAGLVLHAWATIAAAMALYALWPSPWTLGLEVAVHPAARAGRAHARNVSLAPLLVAAGQHRGRHLVLRGAHGRGSARVPAPTPSAPPPHAAARRSRPPTLGGAAPLPRPVRPRDPVRSERRHRGHRGTRLAPVARRPGGRVAPRAGAADRQRGAGCCARGARRLVALPAHVGPAVGHVVPARDAHPEHRRARAAAGRGGPAPERAQRGSGGASRGRSWRPTG